MKLLPFTYSKKIINGRLNEINTNDMTNSVQKYQMKKTYKFYH